MFSYLLSTSIPIGSPMSSCKAVKVEDVQRFTTALCFMDPSQVSVFHSQLPVCLFIVSLHKGEKRNIAKIINYSKLLRNCE